MSVSMPGLSVPARILEIESRLGIGAAATTGNEADAALFGTLADEAVVATDSSLTVDGLLSNLSPSVAPSYVGSVVTADGVLADDVPYADLFRAAGAEHGIQPSILAAVAKVESAFDSTAVSPAGAQGLMQFMPATAQGMGVNPLDPASAIDGAARYLTENLRRFGSLELALAAYNAGPGAVQRHGGIPPFAETQAYVPKVLAAAGMGPNAAPAAPAPAVEPVVAPPAPAAPAAPVEGASSADAPSADAASADPVSSPDPRSSIEDPGAAT